MSWIVGGVLVLAVLIVGGAMAHRAYLHWLLDRTAGEQPVYQVATLDAPAGTTRARVILGGTEETLELRYLSAPEDGADRIGFRPPEGFEESDEGMEPGRRSWSPRDPLPILPGQPVELAFGYDPGAEGTVPVFGHTEARIGLGGMGAGFVVLVGSRSPLEVEASNLRSELLARARGLGVPPRSLPDWSRLEEIEARLASAGEGLGGDPS